MGVADVKSQPFANSPFRTCRLVCSSSWNHSTNPICRRMPAGYAICPRTNLHYMRGVTSKSPAAENLIEDKAAIAEIVRTTRTVAVVGMKDERDAEAAAFEIPRVVAA